MQLCKLQKFKNAKLKTNVKHFKHMWWPNGTNQLISLQKLQNAITLFKRFMKHSQQLVKLSLNAIFLIIHIFLH